MRKLNDSELRTARKMLAEVLLDNEFVREVTPQTVTMLNENGFQMGGRFGAKFERYEGLVIWNKSQRNTGVSFTLSKLNKLELELREKFNEIWGLEDKLN